MPGPMGPVFPVQPRRRGPSASIAMGQLMSWLIPIGLIAGLVVVVVAVWKSSLFSGPSTQTLLDKELTVGAGQAESGTFSTDVYCVYRFTVNAREGNVGMVVDKIAGPELTAADRQLLMRKLSVYPAGEPQKMGAQAEPGKHYGWLLHNPGQTPIRVRVELRLHRD